MRFKRENRILGPISSFNSSVGYQRGEGIGSFLSNLFRSPTARKLFRNTKNLAKKVLKSDLVKNTRNEILNQGISGSKNVINDLLEGESFQTSAKKNLNLAKQQIAKTLKSEIKKAGKRKITGINEKEPVLKTRKLKRGSVKFAPNKKLIQYNKRKKYNLFEDDV